MDRQQCIETLVKCDFDGRYCGFCDNLTPPAKPPRIDHSLIRETFEHCGLSVEHDKRYRMLHHVQRYDEYAIGLSCELGVADHGRGKFLLSVSQPIRDQEHGSINGFYGRLAQWCREARYPNEARQPVPEPYFTTTDEMRSVVHFAVEIFEHIRGPILDVLRAEYNA